MLDRIYIVTDRLAAGDRFMDMLKRLVSAGFNFIQLREKDLSAAELYELGRQIMAMSDDVRLVMNDRVDVALALGAYGVQLTEKSLTPDIVKHISRNLKIGLSVHDKKRVVKYEKYCDFFVFGNVFETTSKPCITGKGVFELKEITSITDKPVYAIGGVNHMNTELVLKAGAYGIALRGPVFGADEPLSELTKIKRIFQEHDA
jgi:thiazole tautomerase (transcriptional regulator TenI)